MTLLCSLKETSSLPVPSLEEELLLSSPLDSAPADSFDGLLLVSPGKFAFAASKTSEASSHGGSSSFATKDDSLPSELSESNEESSLLTPVVSFWGDPSLSTFAS